MKVMMIKMERRATLNEFKVENECLFEDPFVKQDFQKLMAKRLFIDGESPCYIAKNLGEAEEYVPEVESIFSDI
jgi:hypothetical protein